MTNAYSPKEAVFKAYLNAAKEIISEPAVGARLTRDGLTSTAGPVTVRFAIPRVGIRKEKFERVIADAEEAGPELGANYMYAWLKEELEPVSLKVRLPVPYGDRELAEEICGRTARYCGDDVTHVSEMPAECELLGKDGKYTYFGEEHKVTAAGGRRNASFSFRTERKQDRPPTIEFSFPRDCRADGLFIETLAKACARPARGYKGIDPASSR